MRCPRCGTQGTPEARFCAECGDPLARACGGCGGELPSTAKFCPQCGAPVRGATSGRDKPAPLTYTPRHLVEKILHSRSAMEGERKLVTVLFADVRNSTELSASLDPEEWHAILDRFFQILTEGVHRFEGTVNQYTGDGIMAIFGAPIALEDHAQRACYATLQLAEDLKRYSDELRRSRGLNFSTRMGLNSGEVVVGKIGDDLRMDYTAQGQTVGLAARIEEIAAPDRVYLAESTAKLARGYFQLRDLGPFELRGSSTPMHVYELEGLGALRTRLDLSRSRGFSRFVGRTVEMKLLETALERAEAGQPQIVGLVGEAGVGKSRLCLEFLERCRARGVMTYETHGVAHGKAVPLLPMLRLFRAFFAITDDDSAPTAREKIAGRLLLLGERFREVLPLVFDLLGVADPRNPATRADPDARLRQIAAVIRDVSQARGRSETTVFLLEDLHWFDGASEAFLEPLLDSAPGARGLFVINFRPEYQARWMQRTNYQQVPLSPLGPEAADELLQELLGSDPSLDELAKRIRERTGCNPFFMEELVQALIEAGSLVGERGAYRLTGPIGETALPQSVLALLSARIDRLPEREKHVLQTAAVIGKTFAEPLLETVAELPSVELQDALRTLRDTELVYEQVLFPVTEYAFKHPLTHEAALSSQLRDRRTRTHEALARALETAHRDKLDENAALLAYHWEQAGRAPEAARWHAAAARWAGPRDVLASSRHWRRVRDLLEGSPISEESAALGLECRIRILANGWRTGVAAAEIDRLFDEGRPLAEAIGSARYQAMLLGAYALSKGSNGDVASYLRWTLEAARVAERTGDPAFRMETQDGLVYAHYLMGRPAEALRLCDEALSWAPGGTKVGLGVSGVEPYTFLVFQRSVNLGELGRLEEASAEIGRAIRLAAEDDDVDNLAWTTLWQVRINDFRGESSDSLVQARRGFEIVERSPSPGNRLLAHFVLSSALRQEGRLHEALEACEEALRIVHESRAARFWEPLILTELARIHLANGDAKNARTVGEDSIALARQMGTRICEFDARVAWVRALLAGEGLEARARIETELDSVLDLSRQTEQRRGQPLVHELRAELAHLAHDEDTRKRELREAHRLFVEMAATGHARRLEHLLAS